MTPQEKAKQLLETYSNVGMGDGWAEQCALITCDEVLGYMGADRGYTFWLEVKQALNNKEIYDETGYPMQ